MTKFPNIEEYYNTIYFHIEIPYFSQFLLSKSNERYYYTIQDILPNLPKEIVQKLNRLDTAISEILYDDEYNSIDVYEHPVKLIDDYAGYLFQDVFDYLQSVEEYKEVKISYKGFYKNYLISA